MGPGSRVSGQDDQSPGGRARGQGLPKEFMDGIVDAGPDRSGACLASVDRLWEAP